MKAPNGEQGAYVRVGSFRVYINKVDLDVREALEDFGARLDGELGVVFDDAVGVSRRRPITII